VLRYKTETSLL